jgi:hypothetical protein
VHVTAGIAGSTKMIVVDSRPVIQPQSVMYAPLQTTTMAIGGPVPSSGDNRVFTGVICVFFVCLIGLLCDLSWL